MHVGLHDHRVQRLIGDAVLGALVPLSTDHPGGFDLNEFQHGTDRFADHVDAIAT